MHISANQATELLFCRGLASSDSKQALQNQGFSRQTGNWAFQMEKSNENWGPGICVPGSWEGAI